MYLRVEYKYKRGTMVEVNLIHDTREIGWFRRSFLRPEPVVVDGMTKFVGKLALSLWLVALLVLVLPNSAGVWYGLFPETTEKVAQSLSQAVDVKKSEFGALAYEKPEVYQPALDTSLPVENRIVIEKIGLNTVIGEGDVEEALKTGVWRAGDLGDPFERDLPTILAAHRFGYLKWTNEYRRLNSFYNLPKLENGDKVEIVWNQRKYVYEVYEGYTDSEIKDYEADLILYTCEVLNSDRRIIRHARLIES